MNVLRTSATAVVGATLAVVGILLFQELDLKPAPQPPDPEMIRNYRMNMGNTPAMAPGIRLPPTVPAEECQLADDAVVIGIQVNDSYRAYSVKAMSSIETHVVNDRVGDQPVSVTYCDRLDCARVLTDTNEKELLTVGVGAWLKGEMNLRLNGTFYPQTSKDIPLDDLPFVKTTWKSWRTEHPETDVFTEHVPVDGTPAG